MIKRPQTQCSRSLSFYIFIPASILSRVYSNRWKYFRNIIEVYCLAGRVGGKEHVMLLSLYNQTKRYLPVLL